MLVKDLIESGQLSGSSGINHRRPWRTGHTGPEAMLEMPIEISLDRLHIWHV